MEEIKRKRGRPKKVKLPEEIKTLIQEVQQEKKTEPTKVSESIPESIKSSEWDVPKEEYIKFFDKRLSYELTGYKPITETQGLDFDPSWFTVARDTYIRTGKYCSYRIYIFC